MEAGLIAALVAGGGALALWHRRRQRSFAAERAAVFDDCRALFDETVTEDCGVDYPRLSGRYQGASFELQPLLDHIGYRKVPSLWLSLTLRTPLPLAGTFDVLMRPQNIEFWSASAQLEERIDLPADWPAHHIAKVSPAGWRPPLERLRDGLGALAEDPPFKELLVSPRGVRLVHRLCGVERAHYLVLRSLLPENTRIAPEMLVPLLDAALNVASALKVTSLEKAA